MKKKRIKKKAEERERIEKETVQSLSANEGIEKVIEIEREEGQKVITGIKKAINKLQELPVEIKIILLAVIMIVLGGIMMNLWLKSFVKKIPDISQLVNNQISDISKNLKQEGKLLEIPPLTFSQDLSNEWKVYRDEKYDLELKYPENASCQRVITETEEKIEINVPDQRLNIKITPYLNKEKYQSVEDLIYSQKEKRTESSILPSIPLNYFKVTLPTGISAIGWDIKTGKNNESVFIMMGKRYYYIWWVQLESEGDMISFNDENVKTLQNILLSFRILE